VELSEQVGNCEDARMAAACTAQLRVRFWAAKAAPYSKVIICAGMVAPGLVLMAGTTVTSTDEGVLPEEVLLKLPSP
jgi:hypothetical protein